MNPFKFAIALSVLIGTVIPLVSSVVVPRADTPPFYLVSSSASASANLLPLRMNGGAGGGATLTGNGPIGKFYFYQGRLSILDPAGSSFTYRPLIGAVQTSSGCSTDGPLGFVQGSSTNKCALYDSFQIQSNTQNSQLGVKLVFNYVGGFYACGGRDIWYKKTPQDGLSGCSAVDLYTVPVV